MGIIVSILAVLLAILWVKIKLNSNRLSDFEVRVNSLARQLSNAERLLEELRDASAPQKEAAPAKPAAAEPPPPQRPAARVAEPSAPPARIEPEPAAYVPPPGIKPRPEPAGYVPPPRIEPEPVPDMKARPRYVPPAKLPSSPPVTPAPSSREMPKFDWESIVGVKLFSWIAGVALLLAAIFFLRYSISQGWLMPPVRMAIGILVGIGLLTACELKAARKYPVTANAMDASAIAILFSTFFAARVLWNLIGAFPAFALMVLVTAVAVLLSIRRDSVFIALLGLVGGFATPALLSTGENSPISLFTYILLLNAGLTWIATKKKWPLLTTLSLVFTVLYQWDWVMKFLTASQVPIALGIFLVFPILAFVAIALGRKEEPGKGWVSLYGQTANLTALLPLLFALYMATIPGYGHRYVLLFGFLFMLDAGLFAIAIARRQELLHVLGGFSTILIFALWLRSSYESSAWPGILGFIFLFEFFFLAAPSIGRRFGREFKDMGKSMVYTAPLLLFAMPCLAMMEPACADPALLFATLFLILLGTSAYAVFSEEGPLYFIAALAALLAEAAWSAKYLTPERLFSGLTLYAVFGLLYIGVPMAANRWHKRLRPESAGAGLLLASLGLLFFLAAGPMASVSIWGLALLLLILNAGLLWLAAACRIPTLATVGMVVSWIVLGVLWASISLAAMLIPALVVVAGFAMLVLAGNIWMQRRSAGADASLSEDGIFLGLTGHVFLLIVAAQKALSIPPWPFLGILLLLDLAIGAAALYTRRNSLHYAAMTASSLILMVWVTVAGVPPWPSVAIYSAGALVLFSFLWVHLAERIGIDAAPFSFTAATTVLLAQVVAIIGADQAGSPGVGFLLAVHLILLIALMGLSWFYRTGVFALLAVLPSALAVSLWCIGHSGPEFWQQQLLFAVPVYLVFIAYPLIFGRRAGRALTPYLAAVLASIPFFFQARHAVIQAGWGEAIGILPVAQALLMALLLMRLLKIEPPGERNLGRLALVAGAAFAFVTVAIPLQLEREWITIGWALEAAALAWLCGKIPHKGLLYATSGLFAVVFFRLALYPFVPYQPRAQIRIWNWYLYTYLIAAAAMIVGGWLLSKTKNDSILPSLRISELLPGGGALMLFLLLNIEIADFYSTGATIRFNFTATLAQDLTYTLGWAVFALALLAVGIFIRSQPARVSSLALLVITIFKCFIHDLARLGGLYRIASFVALAICLALVALALQRFVLSARREES